MIDWWAIVTNGLWILGLAAVLAVWSYHRWRSQQARQRWSAVFQMSSVSLLWTGGWALTFIGWALSQSTAWWTKAIFFGMALFFLWETVALARGSFATRKRA